MLSSPCTAAPVRAPTPAPGVKTEAPDQAQDQNQNQASADAALAAAKAEAKAQAKAQAEAKAQAKAQAEAKAQAQAKAGGAPAAAPAAVLGGGGGPGAARGGAAAAALGGHRRRRVPDISDPGMATAVVFKNTASVLNRASEFLAQGASRQVLKHRDHDQEIHALKLKHRDLKQENEQLERRCGAMEIAVLQLRSELAAMKKRAADEAEKAEARTQAAVREHNALGERVGDCQQRASALQRAGKLRSDQVDSVQKKLGRLAERVDSLEAEGGEARGRKRKCSEPEGWVEPARRVMRMVTGTG